MKLYRIYTENQNESGIRELASTLFDSYTILKGCGVWKKQTEPSLILELVTDDGSRVKALATVIRELNHQEAVLVTFIDVYQELI